MGNTEIRLNPDKVQAIITDLTNFRNQKIGPSITKVTEANEDVSSPCDLGSFKLNAGSHSENLKNRIADLQTCLDAAKAANDCGITTKKSDGTIAYIVADGHSETIENIKKDNPIDDWRAAKKDAADLVNASEKGIKPEDWDKLIQRIQAKQDDPEYAATMLNTIGPGRLLDLPIDIDDQFTVTTDGGTISYRDGAGTDLATALGHIIATRSQTWSDDEAKKYAERLTFYAEEKNKNARIDSLNEILSASRWEDVDGDGSTEAIGLKYGDAFLLELATRIENFKSKGGYDPRKAISYPGTNSLEGIVHALTGNPETALKWIVPQSSSGTVDAKSVAERTRKLIGKSAVGDNSWTNDWAIMSASISGIGTSDHRSSSDKNGERSSAAVSGILNTVGESDNELVLSQTARMMFSKTLQRYPAGVASSAKIGNSEHYTDNTKDGAQPILSDLALSNLIGQIGQDDRSMIPLIASQTAYNNLQIAQQVEACKATGEYTPLAAVLNKQAQTNGFFAGAIARTSKQIGKNADDRYNAYIDAGAAALQAIPIASSAGKVAQASYSFLKTQATNTGKVSLKAAVANAEADADENNQQNYAEGYRENEATITMALLKSGLYSEEEMKRMRTSAEFPETVNTVVDEDGNLTLSSSPSADQYEGVARLSDQLPNGARPGLGPVSSVSTEYTKAHDSAATGSPARRK
ncbi:DUF6571 family protein [Actinomyces oris]|jgi:hypothetical protein|uniref:DUF6571 family protein n=1 Tax=Actinomyces oris TaxID=544580 RepID=UPI000AA930E4|nr:DUF6571 family protein [Actinomyces oris]